MPKFPGEPVLTTGPGTVSLMLMLKAMLCCCRGVLAVQALGFVQAAWLVIYKPLAGE